MEPWSEMIIMISLMISLVRDFSIINNDDNYQNIDQKER